MRWWPAVFALLLVGCGGSRGSASGDDRVLYSESRLFGPQGGTLRDAERGIEVSIPAGALRRSTTIRLRVTETPRPATERPNADTSDDRVTLELEPTALAPDAKIRVSLPFAEESYSPLGSSLFAMDSDGVLVPLAETFDDPGDRLMADITPAALDALSESNRAMVTLDLFTSDVDAPKLRAPFVSSLKHYNPSTRTFDVTRSTPILPGKRIGVVVHGINSSLEFMTYLADSLARRRTASGEPVYDYIVGFEYTSNAPISQIGTAFASAVASPIEGAARVDVWAHSMGCLVSRYAMESPALGAARIGPKVANYVGLAGPQEGVPLGPLKTFAWLFGLEAEPCLNDLGTSRMGNWKDTPFLNALNSPTSPEVGTAKYHTYAGTDYSSFSWPLGSSVSAAYYLLAWRFVECDGVVAGYSAHSPVLATKSAFWAQRTWPSRNVNHYGAREDVFGCTPGSNSTTCTLEAVMDGWFQDSLAVR